MASKDAPDRPFLVNPTAYSPALPFHPFGNGFFGIPSLEKNSFSCPIQTFPTTLDSAHKLDNEATKQIYQADQ
jgi:hypothetical protein